MMKATSAFHRLKKTSFTCRIMSPSAWSITSPDRSTTITHDRILFITTHMQRITTLTADSSGA